MLKINNYKLRIFYEEYNAYKDIIFKLDKLLRDIDEIQFFNNLEIDSIPTYDVNDNNGDVSLVTTPGTANQTPNNPNIYFLCKYIIDELNNKVEFISTIAFSPSSGPSSGTSLGIPTSSGTGTDISSGTGISSRNFSLGTRSSTRPSSGTRSSTRSSTRPSTRPSSGTSSGGYSKFKGGEPNKSSKFKITKKHNKKQYKKKTRKYPH
jgi:hypothetical protein